MLTIGTAMSVPLSLCKMGRFNSLRMVSMPLTSSPCTAAVITSVGPGFLPCKTCMGMDSVVQS